jgi:hypothetical protein
VSIIQLHVILQSSDDPAAGNNCHTGAPGSSIVQPPVQTSPSRSSGRSELEAISEQCPRTPDDSAAQECEESIDSTDSQQPQQQLNEEKRKSVVSCHEANGRASVEMPEGVAPDAGCGAQSDVTRRSSASRAGKKLTLPLNVSSSAPGVSHMPSDSVQKLASYVVTSDESDSSLEQPASFEPQTPIVTQSSSFVEGHDTVDGGLQVPMTAPVLTSHKGDSMRLLVKMNRKIRSCLRFAARPGAEAESGLSEENRPAEHSKLREIRVLDLTSDDVTAAPSVQKLSYAELTHIGTSKSVCLINGGPA